jgi:hypothetical protein
MGDHVIIKPYFEITVENVEELGVVHKLPLDPHFANAASKDKCNEDKAKQKIFFLI